MKLLLQHTLHGLSIATIQQQHVEFVLQDTASLRVSVTDRQHHKEFATCQHHIESL